MKNTTTDRIQLRKAAKIDYRWNRPSDRSEQDHAEIVWMNYCDAFTNRKQFDRIIGRINDGQDSTRQDTR